MFSLKNIKPVALLLALMLVLSGISFSFAQPEIPDHRVLNEELPSVVEGEYIVRLKDPAAGSMTLQSAEDPLQVIEHFSAGKGLARVRYKASGPDFSAPIPMSALNQQAQSVLDEIRQDPRVAYAQPNFIYYNQSASEDFFKEPFHGHQWGIYNTGQTVAKSTTNPDGHTGIAGIDTKALEALQLATGEGVIVAVGDNGVLSHPDLISNLLADDKNPQNLTHNSYGTYYGHGTHVAGIIAAQLNEVGLAGIAPNAKILPYNLFYEWYTDANGNSVSYTTTAEVLHYIDYIQEKGATISNNSWGYNQPWSGSLREWDRALYDALKALEETHLFVVAAGNSSANMDEADKKYFPAALGTFAFGFEDELGNPLEPLKNVLSVAAVDNSGDLSWFSNYGASTVHLAAPGSYIASTYPSDGYVYMNGTSMAAPFVAGTAALMKEIDPELIPEKIIQIIQETVRKETNSAEPLGELIDKVISGGMLNTYAAVAKVKQQVESQVPSLAIDPSDMDVTVAKEKTLPFVLALTGKNFSTSLTKEHIQLSGAVQGITVSQAVYNPDQLHQATINLTFPSELAAGTLNLLVKAEGIAETTVDSLSASLQLQGTAADPGSNLDQADEEAPEPPEQYSLTLVASPSGSGSLESNKTGPHIAGREILLTASPSEGYNFVHWKKGDNVISANAQFTYVMPAADTTLTAFFEVIPTEVEPAPSAGGGGGGGGGAPGSARIQLLPARDNTITRDDFSVFIPKSALEAESFLNIRPRSDRGMEAAEGSSIITKIYVITLDDTVHLQGYITLTFNYNPEDVAEGQRASLFWFDTENKEWVELENTVVDPEKKVVRGDIDHLTPFAVLAVPDETAVITPIVKPLTQETTTRTIRFTVDQQGYMENNVRVTSDAAPYIHPLPDGTGRIMVPVSFVSRAVGADEVRWNETTRQVTVVKGDDILHLTIGETVLRLNDQVMVMDVPAVIQPVTGGGRTMIPVAHMARALSVDYSWDPITRSVTFTVVE